MWMNHERYNLINGIKKREKMCYKEKTRKIEREILSEKIDATKRKIENIGKEQEEKQEKKTSGVFVPFSIVHNKRRNSL